MMKKLFFPALVCSLLLLCSQPALSSAVAWHNYSATELSREVESQTRLLMAFAKQHGRIHGASKKALEQEMISLARERREFLADLIEKNPGAALRLTMPGEVRSGMPEAVRSLVEQKQEIQGELQVTYTDYAQAPRLGYEVDMDGKRFSVHFKAHEPRLQSGVSVRVSGLEVDGRLAVESGQTDLEVLNLGGTGSGGSGTPPLSNTLGEQRTLVLLVNFQNQVEQPITQAAADARVFTDTSEFMRENSYGQTWLSGDTRGWFTLPLNATCNGTDIANAANSAASASGVNLSAYDRFIYMFPRNTTCGWDGQGTVGGWPSKTWINGNFNLQVVAHEVGHNFGLYHSHSIEAGAEILSATPTIYEYGDTLDTMGNKNPGHFSVFHKNRLGWLGYGAASPVVETQGAGSFTVDAVEPAGSNPKALKVLRSVDAVTGAKTWFTVEYRQDMGFDSWLTGYANVLGGVVIHLVKEGDANSSNLLDMTPASSLYYDWNDPALTVGRTFTDPESGVSISTTSANGVAAGLNVTYGAGNCQNAAPTLALAPAQGPWVAPGTAVDFTLTLTNRDSSACSAVNFDLSQSIPSGWSGNFGPSTLVLAPGQSGSTTLTLTSSTGAADGFYNFTATARNGANANLFASASGTYVVSAPVPNSAPVAVADQTTTPERTAVTIPVLANDSDPDGDALSIAGVTSGSNGTVTINANGTLTYAPKGRFKGTDVFHYWVSDGKTSATASVTVTVGATSGGSTGGKGGRAK